MSHVRRGWVKILAVPAVMVVVAIAFAEARTAKAADPSGLGYWVYDEGYFDQDGDTWTQYFKGDRKPLQYEQVSIDKATRTVIIDGPVRFRLSGSSATIVSTDGRVIKKIYDGGWSLERPRWAR
jgi:hypothetical protein